MLKNIALLILPAALTACGGQEIENDPAITKAVVASVAQQTLGEAAISVNPFAFQKINVPGIYAVRANEATGRHTYIEICSKDMAVSAIADMEREERTSNRTFTDFLDGRNVEVSTPFVLAKTKYTLQSVDGFEAVSVRSGGSTDAAEWILENVEDTCKNEVLERNLPYFVAVGVAKSKSINVVKGGGIDVVPLTVGIATVDIELSDKGSRVVNTERVFAISGKLYKASGVTSHGSF